MLVNMRSKISRKILNYFFLNEKARVYVNEMARVIEEEPKNVHRILLRLEESGLLVDEFSGRERYFSANMKSPIYKEFKTIFLKTSGIEQSLKKDLKKLEGLKDAYIYGSYANGKYKPGSDIDVLLIGSHSSIEAQNIIYALQKALSTEINTINMTEVNFEKRKKEQDQLVTTIFGGKVIRLL